MNTTSIYLSPCQARRRPQTVQLLRRRGHEGGDGPQPELGQRVERRGPQQQLLQRGLQGKRANVGAGSHGKEIEIWIDNRTT